MSVLVEDGPVHEHEHVVAVRPEQRPTDPNRVGGRGIALIDRLANRWGTRDETDGKTVWVELADA